MHFKSAAEEHVVEAIVDGRDELVSLVSDLVAYDTTAREPSDPPREERDLQRRLKDRLTALGAETELWEPDPIGLNHPFCIPAGLSFVGRPQLIARISGIGGGRSLLLNGHIDTVNVGSIDSWSSDPFRAEIRDGRLYGRGANDMKGGLASLLFALEALARTGVRLHGDVVFCTNTDEESSGAGGWALASRGITADAGICAEPSGFDAWLTCRGVMLGRMTVRGRAAHGDMPQAHWQVGGGVNAIERMVPLLQAVLRLRDEWRTRPDNQHPLLAPGDVLPTVVQGGSWYAAYPESCDVYLNVVYLPAQADDGGTGRCVRSEIMRFLGAQASADPWLADHPLEWSWLMDLPPAEVPADHGIVRTALAAGADVGRPGTTKGMNSWHDAASFTLYGSTPCISFGPGGFESAHGVDEYVPVQDLTDHCAAMALTIMRWCEA